MTEPIAIHDRDGELMLEIRRGPPTQILEVAAWGPLPKVPTPARLIAVGPGRWWARDYDPRERARLQAAAVGAAAVFDLGGGRCSVRISGRLGSELLALTCSFPLARRLAQGPAHARVAGVDCLAVCTPDGVELLAPSSYLDALWDGLAEAAETLPTALA
jgi:sarcosine oxidase gamma subunit